MIKMLNEHELEQIVGGRFEELNLEQIATCLRDDPSTNAVLRGKLLLQYGFPIILGYFTFVCATTCNTYIYRDTRDARHPRVFERKFSPTDVVTNFANCASAGNLVSFNDLFKQ